MFSKDSIYFFIGVFSAFILLSYISISTNFMSPELCIMLLLVFTCLASRYKNNVLKDESNFFLNGVIFGILAPSLFISCLIFDSYIIVIIALVFFSSIIIKSEVIEKNNIEQNNKTFTEIKSCYKNALYVRTEKFKLSFDGVMLNFLILLILVSCILSDIYTYIILIIIIFLNITSDVIETSKNCEKTFFDLDPASKSVLYLRIKYGVINFKRSYKLFSKNSFWFFLGTFLGSPSLILYIFIDRKTLPLSAFFLTWKFESILVNLFIILILANLYSKRIKILERKKNLLFKGVIFGIVTSLMLIIFDYFTILIAVIIFTVVNPNDEFKKNGES